jgi:HlyD family secretion protein
VIPLQAVTIREVEVDADGKYVVPDLAALDKSKEGKAAAADAAAAPKSDKEVPKKELEGIFFREGERVRFRPVKLGIKGESDVEVLDGLAEGDEIVTGSYRVLRVLTDGDFVDVQNGEGAAVAKVGGKP